MFDEKLPVYRHVDHVIVFDKKTSSHFLLTPSSQHIRRKEDEKLYYINGICKTIYIPMNGKEIDMAEFELVIEFGTQRIIESKLSLYNKTSFFCVGASNYDYSFSLHG